MNYFDCFVVGAWMFAIGWFAGAVYMQNHSEETHALHLSGEPEPCEQCEALRIPILAGISAD